jgi:hypothetical protein
LSVRVILTIIAIALVTLLTAALVVPYFVDWSAHRAEIAGRLEALTGGSVTLNGPVTLRLLPTPYIEVGAGAAIGAGPDAPRLTFEGARLELALVKLASGAFRFTDVRLEKPVLTLTRAAGGGLILPAAAPGDAVGFDRFSVRDGTVRIAAKSGGEERTIAGVELDGDAPSLAGPYHVSGQAAGPGGVPIVFRLGSGTAGPGGAPVRIAIDPGPVWPAIEFDGTFAASGPKGPNGAGTAVMTGTSPGVDGPTPWRAAGKLAADLDGAALTSAEFRFGPEERALRAEGSARFERGQARFTIEAKAKQANLDATFRRKGEDAVPPARAAALLSAVFAPALAGAGPAALDARLAVDSVILGGDTLERVAASLRVRPGEPLTTRFDLGLPGKSRLKGEGVVETGEAASFIGAVDLSTEDSALLGEWAGQGAPELGAWASALADALPAQSLAVSGEVEAAKVGFSGKNLKIALGRSILTGSLALTRPVGADPGRIYADLAADSLDVDALPSFDAARSMVGGYDVSLSLTAKALSVAHVGEAGIDGASLVLKLSKTGPNFALDRLAVAGLGGASVEATGAFGPDGATASGRLSAGKLADFAALISRLAPGPWSRAFVQRAPLLSPASIAFDARGVALAAGGAAFSSVNASGTIARTTASLSLQPTTKNDGEAMTLVLDSPDAAALLRQIGLGAAAAPGGAGHAELRASGAWERGFDVDAAASVAGAMLTGRGRYAPTAGGDEASLFGSVKLNGGNVTPLASVLGLAPASGAIGPVDASADVTLRGERWNVSRLAATVAGVRATGELSYEPPPESVEPVASPDLSRAEEAVNGPAASASPPPAAITGALTVDRLRLSDLTSLALGPPRPAASGAQWSDAKFAAPPLNLPAASVRLNVGTLSVADGLSAQGFSTDLLYDRGRLDLDDFAMKLAAGAVSGRATLRRSRETATLDGALKVEPLPLRRGAFSGRVGGHVDFASTGRSVAALIAGLAGGGGAEFSGAALAASDPDALDRVVTAAQTPDAQIDETNVAYQFAASLDKGPLAIPDGTAPVSLSAGTAKLGPVAIARPHVEASLEASLDLVRLAVETRLQLTAPAAGLKFWSGPNPSAMVTLEDALGAPKRQVDVAGLSAGLATQAITRESDRIASLEADIRERAFVNRRLKGERFLDRRNAEIEDWRAEQERLRGLAQHLAEQRVEEQRLAAEKAAAEKSATEKAQQEKAQQEKAAEEAEEKAARDKAEREKAGEENSVAPRPIPDRPAEAPVVRPPQRSDGATKTDEYGAASNAPIPPARPKPKLTSPASAPDPSASGIY